MTGGVDDNVRAFKRSGGTWLESGALIALNNGAGNGITKGIPALGIGPFVGAQAAGIAVSGETGVKCVRGYRLTTRRLSWWPA